MRGLLTLGGLLWIAAACCNLQAQDTKPAPIAAELSADEQQLLAAAQRLSETTKSGGAGWEAYAQFLHDDFTRWSAQQPMMDRAQTVGAIQSWWEGGNRVDKSEENLISTQLAGETGVLRRKFTEWYIDQDGNDAGKFSGYVTQVWVRAGETWLLLAATIENEK